MKFLILLSFIFFIFVNISFSQRIDYDDQSCWPGVCQTGNKQSPIDFKKEIHYKSTSGIFELIDSHPYILKGNFDFYHQFKLGVVLDRTTSGSVEILYKNQLRNYYFSDIHFHYKSEHRFDDYQYDLEMHTVTVSQDGTYLVFANLFKLSNVPNPEIAKLKKGSDIGNFDLNRFININSPFYFYEGSLTTPNCDENVLWVVFMNPITEISMDQLSMFRLILQENGYLNNNRNVQHLVNRDVYVKRKMLKYLN